MIWSKFFCIYQATSSLKDLEGRIRALRARTSEAEVSGGLGLFDPRGSSWFDLFD